jgi:homoserine O-acetyltransferase
VTGVQTCALPICVLNTENKSVGIVKPQYFTFAEPPNELLLETEIKLGPITICYETYGKLSPKKDNAILILHALSGDAHVAGYNSSEDKKPGWWDSMVGPGKAFDTDKYFIICSNILGGCKGSTGPSSINPKTGKPYAMSFPIITIKDMVRCQYELLKHLGIKKLLSACGGSMGGMQALEWAVTYPEMCRSVIPIATTYLLSAQGIAFNEVGRQAIIMDPNWNRGDYYDKPNKPHNGLSLARMIAHITYLSDTSMHQKFGRQLRNRAKPDYKFEIEFQVESYLHYQGDSFVKRFDANTYLYITKAMDYFDMTQGFSTLKESMRRAAPVKFLLISFSSDWLFPPYQMKEITSALRSDGIDVTYCDIKTDYGHDAFLLEVDEMTQLITHFLEHLNKKD